MYGNTVEMLLYGNTVLRHATWASHRQPRLVHMIVTSLAVAEYCAIVGLLDYWIIGLLDCWIIGASEIGTAVRCRDQGFTVVGDRDCRCGRRQELPSLWA